MDPVTGTNALVWRPGVPLDDLIGGQIQRLLRRRDGTLWLGGEQAVFRPEPGRWRPLPYPADSGDLRCRRLVEDADGRLWVVRGGKLFHVEADAVLPFAGGAALADAFVTDVLPDPAGGLWVTTRYGGLSHLAPVGVQVLTTQDGLPHNSVSSVSPERGGGVWVGTLRGVARWRADQFEVPGSEVPLAGLNARTVFEDHAGDLWVASSFGQGGQMLWLEPQPSGYRRLLFECGTQEPSVLHEDRSGRLWLGGRSGLECLLTNYLARTPGGEVLGVSVHRKRASRWQIRPDEVSHFAGKYYDVFHADRWKSWLPVPGAWQPLAELPPGRTDGAPFPVSFQPPNFYFRAFAETPDGSLWLGSWGAGLFRIHAGTVTRVTIRDGLPSDQIHCLFTDPAGILWVGTPRGLGRLTLRGSRGDEAPSNSALRTPHLNGASPSRLLP